MRLCSICSHFDVRSLLLAAQAQHPLGSRDRSQDFERQENLAHAGYRSFRRGLPRFFKQHADLSSLKLAASECDLCAAIWKQYSESAQPQELTAESLSSGLGKEQIYIGTTPWDRDLHALPHVAAFQHGDRGIIRTLAWFEACAPRGQEPSDHQDLLARSIYDHSGSEECLSLAQHWLQTCIHEHKECNVRTHTKSRLPTRVIDTKFSGNTPPMAKLVDGEGRADAFAALSYCWGGERDLILTRATETNLRTGLELRRFPATLRDAITMVWKLKIRYIWIDAVCIMQDSPDDWAREAAKMRDVYKGAVVTIAAASASKASGGLFCERAPPNSYCHLDWLTGDEQSARIFLRPGSELWDTTLSTSSINTRGWTLQETLLAPRSLWFGRQQISFECSRGNIDEAGRSTGAVETYRSKAFMQRMSRKKRQMILYKTFRAIHIPPLVRVYYISFSYIPRDRSLKSLYRNMVTYQTVFLQGLLPTPALSGLADDFHQLTGDTYFAGLWKADIIRGLNWQRGPLRKKLPSGRVEDVTSHPKFLAPSWSWASILGKSVRFLTGFQESNKIIQSAKVISIETEPSTEDPYGKLKGGYIMLRGPFLDLGVRDPRCKPELGSKLSVLLEKISCTLNSANTAQSHEFLQKHKSHERQRFSLFHLCTWMQEEPIKWTEVSLLLLESCPEGSYKRVANFSIRISMDLLLRDDFQSASWKKQMVRIV
ncbi:HET-domain-containing protein [Glonium stellatum]|uniref:HET-domain-containing protein n=1 Tax=Glonium stellatum TaxID=574774 RepID=A0A8E2EQ32_9PEZI|nr:HET-domain-containing protein [Glonium stellatum]